MQNWDFNRPAVTGCGGISRPPRENAQILMIVPRPINTRSVPVRKSGIGVWNLSGRSVILGSNHWRPAGQGAFAKCQI